MYEKLGLSLAQTNKYEINIIGFSIKKNIFQTNVKTYPIFNFSRLGIARLVQPIRYLNILLKVKPKIVIVNSHDFLLVTTFYSILTGAVFIYDLQENFLRNILYNSGISAPFKYILGYWVRLKEYACHPFIHHYLVAEEGYFKEIPSIQKKGLLLRNLYVNIFNLPRLSRKPGHNIRILYSGTIAWSYGILSILSFMIRFHNQCPEIEFRIVGYCPHGPTLEKLKKVVIDNPFIQLIGGEELVPHQKIIQEIRTADFGIINYELNPAIKNCFPTRIYEYMANQLPMLIQHYPPWSDYCLKYNAGILVDFENTDFNKLIMQMNNYHFFTKGIPEEIFWRNEEPILLDLFDRITDQISTP